MPNLWVPCVLPDLSGTLPTPPVRDPRSGDREICCPWLELPRRSGGRSTGHCTWIWRHGPRVHMESVQRVLDATWTMDQERPLEHGRPRGTEVTQSRNTCTQTQQTPAACCLGQDSPPQETGDSQETPGDRRRLQTDSNKYETGDELLSGAVG
jgi:hypothetical protein